MDMGLPASLSFSFPERKQCDLFYILGIIIKEKIMQVLHLYPQTQRPYPHKDTYNMFVIFPCRLPEGNQALKHDSIHYIKFTGTKFYFYEAIM